MSLISLQSDGSLTASAYSPGYASAATLWGSGAPVAARPLVMQPVPASAGLFSQTFTIPRNQLQPGTPAFLPGVVANEWTKQLLISQAQGGAALSTLGPLTVQNVGVVPVSRLPPHVAAAPATFGAQVAAVDAAAAHAALSARLSTVQAAAAGAAAPTCTSRAAPLTAPSASASSSAPLPASASHSVQVGGLAAVAQYAPAVVSSSGPTAGDPFLSSQRPPSEQQPAKLAWPALDPSANAAWQPQPPASTLPCGRPYFAPQPVPQTGVGNVELQRAASYMGVLSWRDAAPLPVASAWAGGPRSPIWYASPPAFGMGLGAQALPSCSACSGFGVWGGGLGCSTCRRLRF